MATPKPPKPPKPVSQPPVPVLPGDPSPQLLKHLITAGVVLFIILALAASLLTRRPQNVDEPLLDPVLESVPLGPEGLGPEDEGDIDIIVTPDEP